MQDGKIQGWRKIKMEEKKDGGRDEVKWMKR